MVDAQDFPPIGWVFTRDFWGSPLGHRMSPDVPTAARGDLMESNFARENLSLPTMDKVTVLSMGHGQMTEKSFYELLQLNSVRVFAATNDVLLAMSTWNDCIAILKKRVEPTIESRLL